MRRHHIIITVILMCFCCGCISRQTLKETPAEKTKKNLISYSGGSGDSYETAIVINASKGFLSSRDLASAEYDYINGIYGKKDNDWSVAEQSRVSEDGKNYDMIRARINKNDKLHFFIFDVDALTSKPRPSTNATEQRQE
jgi:hypothetical protein